MLVAVSSIEQVVIDEHITSFCCCCCLTGYLRLSGRVGVGQHQHVESIEHLYGALGDTRYSRDEIDTGC